MKLQYQINICTIYSKGIQDKGFEFQPFIFLFVTVSVSVLFAKGLKALRIKPHLGTFYCQHYIRIIRVQFKQIPAQSSHETSGGQRMSHQAK
jgi:hypothetical protein